LPSITVINIIVVVTDLIKKCAMWDSKAMKEKPQETCLQMPTASWCHYLLEKSPVYLVDIAYPVSFLR
jgi:hypothetical protein